MVESVTRIRTNHIKCTLKICAKYLHCAWGSLDKTHPRERVIVSIAGLALLISSWTLPKKEEFSDYPYLDYGVKLISFLSLSVALFFPFMILTKRIHQEALKILG